MVESMTPGVLGAGMGALAALFFPSFAFAQSTGPPEGLQALNMEFLSAYELPGGSEGGIGDIWVHGNAAYVGTSSCSGYGVNIVDVSHPETPGLVGRLATYPGARADDVVVIRASTPAFEGDLLAVGLQARCGAPIRHGVEFWDVTEPSQPEFLSYLQTPLARPGYGVHELHLVQRPDGRVLALLALEATETNVGDAPDGFRIVDATDPRAPVEVGSWGIGRGLGTLPPALGRDRNLFIHSAYSSDGMVAYLSAWDAGTVILDISDPARPRLVGRAGFADGDEGNAHSMNPAWGGRLLVTADEDNRATILGLQIIAPTSLARTGFEGRPGRMEVAEGSLTTPLGVTGRVVGDLVYVGRACPQGSPPQGVRTADPLLGDPSGKIALFDLDGCQASGKVRMIQEAGAIAVLAIADRPGIPLGMGGGGAGISIPGVTVRADHGELLKEAVQHAPVQVAIGPGIAFAYKDFGYLRLFDASDPMNPVQVGSFATPNGRAAGTIVPQSTQSFSAHNPVVRGNLAYVSWMRDGVRVVDFTEPTNAKEVAYFALSEAPASGVDGATRQSRIWGVAAHDDLVYASDMDYGLYIMRLRVE